MAIFEFAQQLNTLNMSRHFQSKNRKNATKKMKKISNKNKRIKKPDPWIRNRFVGPSMSKEKIIFSVSSKLFSLFHFQIENNI